jgi:hypothetical protein
VLSAAEVTAAAANVDVTDEKTIIGIVGCAIFVRFVFWLIGKLGE